MVIDQVDVAGIAIFEAEDHPPVAGNRDAPVPFQCALQRVKPVAGQVEIRWLAGIVKVRQGERNAIRQGGTHSARIAALVHALQAAMTKPSDHEEVYLIPVHVSISGFRSSSTTPTVRIFNRALPPLSKASRQCVRVTVVMPYFRLLASSSAPRSNCGPRPSFDSGRETQEPGPIPQTVSSLHSPWRCTDPVHEKSQEAVGVDQDRNLRIGFYRLDPGENVVVPRVLYGFPEQMAIGHRFAVG